jgi:hypothetical protein
MKKRLSAAVLLGWLLVASLVSGRAQAGAEIGIDRSNLTRENEAVQQKTLQDIHALHATWFRDVLSGTTPQTVAKFVNELKLAKQNNLKFLANVLPAQADYDDGYVTPNAGEDFRKRCGWPQGSSQLSKINLAKLSYRLRFQFDAVKAANLAIDAFEIGNEVDWICFNGDVPDGHTPAETEWMTAVRGYAHFLKTAAEVIHDPHYFPNAKIITFGIAHSSERWDQPPHHFSNPARMVAMLRNLDGFNYLDNATYHVDGYGTHRYPNPDNLEQSVTDLIHQDAAILGPDKPFWITEWGLPSNKYPNQQGQTRSEGIQTFYGVLDKLHIPLGPRFYYAYSPGGSQLLDAKGALLPEASAVTARTAPAALASNVVVGVNVWNEGFLSKTAQDAEIKQMAESGVKTIRTSLFPNTSDFITQAFQHGIGSVVIVYPFLGSEAKSKGGWADVPLSELNPQEFTAAFKPLLDKLESAGVRLTAIELGNEINTSCCNGDLPDPGSGRELGLSDLNNPNDSEGRAVAAGYRAYLQVMAALNDLRNHSKLNQHTPIITAGLADWGLPAPKSPSKKVDVSLRDTIELFRQNGMDKLVDGYGVHVYPSADLNRPASARISSLEEGVFSACKQGAKSCWMTEWGFGNSDESCPPVDGTRVKLVQSFRSALEHFVSQGRLTGIIYYDWTEVPGKPDSWAIFRCGALTDAGKLALSPL